jgi:hypothetical protein
MLRLKHYEIAEMSRCAGLDYPSSSYRKMYAGPTKAAIHTILPRATTTASDDPKIRYQFIESNLTIHTEQNPECFGLRVVSLIGNSLIHKKCFLGITMSVRGEHYLGHYKNNRQVYIDFVSRLSL